jgi:hypothetical protein
MRDWALSREQLPGLILAADARFGGLNYFDDQIWEILLNSGEPAGVSLRTTYGLRAQSMRIFPQFTEGGDARNDPEKFFEPPKIHRF